MSTNLAKIPDGWSLTYGTGKQIIILDTIITFSGSPTIRLDPHTSLDSNSAREVNGNWINIKPGDHIIAKCWMKTEASKLGDTNPFSGARFGLDFYADKRIAGLQSNNGFPETDAAIQQNYVRWGTSVFTQRIIDFVVPATIIADGSLGYTKGIKVVPTSFVMWLQAWSSAKGSTDPALVWFANSELYLNPSIPTPIPDPIPVPIPLPIDAPTKAEFASLKQQVDTLQLNINTLQTSANSLSASLTALKNYLKGVT